MQYKEFYVRIKSGIVQKSDQSGNQTDCNGFVIEIFDSPEESVLIDMFAVAVGYELLENSLPEAEQLVKDYISMEEKELRKLIDEYHSFEE